MSLFRSRVPNNSLLWHNWIDFKIKIAHTSTLFLKCNSSGIFPSFPVLEIDRLDHTPTKFCRKIRYKCNWGSLMQPFFTSETTRSNNKNAMQHIFSPYFDIHFKCQLILSNVNKNIIKQYQKCCTQLIWHHGFYLDINCNMGGDHFCTHSFQIKLEVQFSYYL